MAPGDQIRVLSRFHGKGSRLEVTGIFWFAGGNRSTLREPTHVWPEGADSSQSLQRGQELLSLPEQEQYKYMLRCLRVRVCGPTLTLQIDYLASTAQRTGCSKGFLLVDRDEYLSMSQEEARGRGQKCPFHSIFTYKVCKNRFWSPSLVR